MCFESSHRLPVVCTRPTAAYITVVQHDTGMVSSRALQLHKILACREVEPHVHCTTGVLNQSCAASSHPCLNAIAIAAAALRALPLGLITAMKVDFYRSRWKLDATSGSCQGKRRCSYAWNGGLFSHLLLEHVSGICPDATFFKCKS